MLSAGLIGGPGLGYSKDRFAGAELQKVSPELFQTYKATKSSKFLNLDATETFGLDGTKLGEARDAKENRSPDQAIVIAADQTGDRNTLKADSFIPATMAVIYLMLLMYFKSIGGYKPLRVEEQRE